MKRIKKLLAPGSRVILQGRDAWQTVSQVYPDSGIFEVEGDSEAIYHISNIKRITNNVRKTLNERELAIVEALDKATGLRLVPAEKRIFGANSALHSYLSRFNATTGEVVVALILDHPVLDGQDVVWRHYVFNSWDLYLSWHYNQVTGYGADYTLSGIEQARRGVKSLGWNLAFNV